MTQVNISHRIMIQVISSIIGNILSLYYSSPN